MDTEIDWQRELDASFGSAPDVPAALYVAAGHRAVRRRRATSAAVAVCAAAVVVGVAWGVAPAQSPRSTETPVATEPPSPSPTGSPSPSPSRTEPALFPWRKGEPPARALPEGLEIRPGAVVHERRDALYPGKDTESAALDISYQGSRWWLVLEWDRGGSSMSSSRPEDGFADSFDAFVRAEVANGGMTSVPADDVPGMAGGLATWHGGNLEAAPGVTVVRQVEDPVPGDDSLGLVLRSGGRTTWALFTQGGDASAWELEAESGWLTFDQWLADHVALETGGPRVRLVELEDDGTVRPAVAGVEVLDQRARPDLPAYGTTEVPSALALVSWQGKRWFVLVVRFDGEDGVTTFAAEKADGATTLDDFITFAADRSDEGGLR
jgi:hypothetical protein